MEDTIIIQANSADTGGSVETYWGLLHDGRYFVFCLDVFEFLNADFGYTFTKPFFDKTGGDTFKWENKHRIAIYHENDGYPDVVKNIIKQVKEMTKCGI